MKINPNVTKKVKDSVNECRKTLVEATIYLLKKIGAEPGEYVVFKNTLFLFQHKGNMTETIICNRIMFNRNDADYYFVWLDEYNATQSSDMLSITSLYAIYEEVRNLVRNH